MHVTGRWPIAHPADETADGLGAGAPTPAPAAPAADDSMVSLSDHQTDYGPEAQRATTADPDDDATNERDERGQFKTRHRAASQRADANDVPLIAEQTKRIRDAEARLGADIARKEGESERVYTLRRRAELLERQSTAPQATAAAPTPTATPQPAQRPVSQPAQRVAPTFPDYAQAIEIPGYEALTYEQWGEQRTRWLYALLRQDERDADEARRAQDAQESQARDIAERTAAHVQRLAAAKTKYPDWDAVVTNSPVKISGVMQHAMLKSDKSDDIQYFLGKNPTIAAELNAESLDYHASAVAPMRRYLDSLVAGQRSTPPSRTAAGPTGAALALVQPPAPRPPTPVRTGTIAAPDTPPGDDDMSLSAHEKHYAPRRRR
jgi:hypothetical protein